MAPQPSSSLEVFTLCFGTTAKNNRCGKIATLPKDGGDPLVMNRCRFHVTQWDNFLAPAIRSSKSKTPNKTKPANTIDKERSSKPDHDADKGQAGASASGSEDAGLWSAFVKLEVGEKVVD
jgi:hypothetical protein